MFCKILLLDLGMCFSFKYVIPTSWICSGRYIMLLVTGRFVKYENIHLLSVDMKIPAGAVNVIQRCTYFMKKLCLISTVAVN